MHMVCGLSLYRHQNDYKEKGEVITVVYYLHTYSVIKTSYSTEDFKMERLGTLCISLALILPCLQWTTCFNLDIDKPYVFSGPEGSYFGFSVDFFQPDAKQ